MPTSAGQESPLPADAGRRKVITLAAVSFLTLFAEVVFIRYLSSETRIFGFYKNFALISCFLGLGAGAAMGGTSVKRWFVPGLAAFGLFVMLAAPLLVALRPPSGDEFIWLPQTTTSLESIKFYIALGLLFAMATSLFYAGGQAVGAAFQGLPPLTAYAANLLGTLAGTCAFTAMSFLHLGPTWWFALILALGLVLNWDDRAIRVPTIAISALTLTFFGLYAMPSSWSPYYKVTKYPATLSDGTTWGTLIQTNATYHLKAIDLSDAFVAAHPAAKSSAAYDYYNLPYRFVKPARVLVMGAGAGNDVAAALRNGAESVTAVEIDPVIAALGRDLHPEHPYASPRVHLVVDDARAFLMRTTERFDLIVYGLLDSHTVVASMSNVRLDNFMYTRESLERAKSLLSPRGMVALSFSSGFGESWWLLKRIAGMLERTFGTSPVILDVGYDRGFGFLAGPGAPTTLTHPADQEKASRARALFEDDTSRASEEELTDDWPFMYLKGRWIPAEYWILGFVILAAAAAMVSRLVPGGLRTIDGHFLFLGAGFLLVEVRNLAEMSLLFGSTWLVNAFVIAGVLIMALVANFVAARVRINIRIAFIALGLAVATSFFSPVKYLSGMDPWIRTGLATAILSLPFLFSGLVFSQSFKEFGSPQVAYGSNLLGAVAGGLLEHASLSSGIRSLSVFALVLYLLAYLTLLRRQAAGAATAA